MIREFMETKRELGIAKEEKTNHPGNNREVRKNLVLSFIKSLLANWFSTKQHVHRQFRASFYLSFLFIISPNKCMGYIADHGQS